MNVSYRNFVPDDIDHIIAFWNENSGWETNLNREEFMLRFCSSPYGNAIIMLAIEDDVNEIMGLFCFLAFHVTLCGKDEKSYRFFGVIFKESFRKKFGITSFLTGKHPLNVLYQKGIEKAKEEKAVILYSIPDPRWGKILKVFPLETRQFPLWSYKLANGVTFSNSDTTHIREVHPSDPDIDILWSESYLRSLCGVTKNALFYQFKIKINHTRYQLKGLYKNNKLVGLFTLSYKSAAYQWTIGDLLTLDNDTLLSLTLQAACYIAHQRYLQLEAEPGKAYKVAILAVPYFEIKLKELGFNKDNYDFVFAIHLLDKNKISKKEMDFDNWYVSATD